MNKAWPRSGRRLPAAIQETIVQNHIQMEKNRATNCVKLERLLQTHLKALKEEQERQIQILEPCLDSELVQELDSGRRTQKEILENKQKVLKGNREMMEKLNCQTKVVNSSKKSKSGWYLKSILKQCNLKKMTDQIEQGKPKIERAHDDNEVRYSNKLYHNHIATKRSPAFTPC